MSGDIKKGKENIDSIAEFDSISYQRWHFILTASLLVINLLSVPFWSISTFYQDRREAARLEEGTVLKYYRLQGSD